MRTQALLSTGCLVVSSLLVGSATAVNMYWLQSPNEEHLGRFGYFVSWAGDVNNDGFNDVIVGAPYEDPGSSPMDAGRAYIFSGQTGALLRTHASPNEEGSGWFGWSVSWAADVNNDGYDDVIVGAHGEGPGSSPSEAGRAYIFSGQTGAVLHTLLSPNEESVGYFGWSVSGVGGDVDGDGYKDVVVGAPREDPGASPLDAGRAYVFSGLTGNVLRTHSSPNEEVNGVFGYSLSGAADVDNDGYQDLVVGAPGEDPGSSPTDAGRAYVFSGQTGVLMWSLASPNEESDGSLGRSVSGIGDANNDGCADVIAGAHFEDPGSSPDNAGRAYIFSGATGTILFTLVSPNEEADGWFGYSVSWAGDVDNAGGFDVTVGAPGESPGSSPTGAGRAYVFAGETGNVLYTLVSPEEEAQGWFGYSVSGAGDVDQDGIPEMVVGAPWENPGFSPTDAGRACVISPYDLTLDLTGWLDAGLLWLMWNNLPQAAEYWIFGTGNSYYFDPDPWNMLDEVPGGYTTWVSPAGIADPDLNYTYVLKAVNAVGLEIAESNRCGEFDFGTGTPP